jgi:magnesium-protoporphyrin O-methyltransferase
MNCCCANTRFDSTFNDRHASKQLEQYRRDGPNDTTRALLHALRAAGMREATLLDIGAGVGIIHHELLGSGARSAVHVDAALAHMRLARDEAARRGHTERVTFVHGDFVGMANEIAPADVVTLDRVICCYPDMERLVTTSASKARHLYGAVFPRERLVSRVGVALENFARRLTRNPFRAYIHSTEGIDAALRRQGLTLRSVADTFIWRVAVYARSQAYQEDV